MAGICGKPRAFHAMAMARAISAAPVTTSRLMFIPYARRSLCKTDSLDRFTQSLIRGFHVGHKLIRRHGYDFRTAAGLELGPFVSRDNLCHGLFIGTGDLFGQIVGARYRDVG